MLVVAVVLGMGAAAPARAAAFSDVPPGHPYRLQVEVLSQVGVISGFPDGTFRPSAPVTRQQFAKMFVLAMRLPVSEADVSPFGDVLYTGPGSLYPDNYVAALVREGITSGTRPGSLGVRPLFSPEVNVLLSQAVTMVSRGAGAPLDAPPPTYRSVWGNFNAAHGPAARLAQYNGLLRGFGLASMNPWRPATRSEAAALLFNLMGTDRYGLNGRFPGRAADLVQLFRDRGLDGSPYTTVSGLSLDRLAQLYIAYGDRFGLRADMAWAQMIHETSFLRFTGDVRPQQNNFAGIGATGGGVPGNSFATAELGIIAQYAHLAWYVYPRHLDDPYCAMSTDPAVPGDPRHFVIDGRPHRGNVRTVLDLSGKWAPGANYGGAIQAYAAQIRPSRGW